jgi:hypothetical protein
MHIEILEIRIVGYFSYVIFIHKKGPPKEPFVFTKASKT